MSGVAPLQGLTGIAKQQWDYDSDPQATPEERYGGTADPRHAIRGEQAVPYSWQSQLVQGGSTRGPYGPANQLLGDEQWFYEPAGDEMDDPYMDRTPATNAAPWPKGIASGPVPGEGPDDIQRQLVQSFQIHGVRGLNASAKQTRTQQGDVDYGRWQEIWDVSPGYSEMQPIPDQLKSSGFMWGTRSREQSFAAQNQYGFDSAHKHRRYADAPIPGNYMWMQPGGRPLVKSLAGPARPPIGPDSPFHGDNLGAAFSINGAYLQNVPTEYSPPATPQLAQAPQDIDPEYDPGWELW